MPLDHSGGDATDIMKAAAAIEADMIDAGKAFPLGACAFPTPEQLALTGRGGHRNRQTPTPDGYVRLTLAVSAGRAQGKTLLLMYLLSVLADSGMLTPEATKRLTQKPFEFFSERRGLDEEGVETITLDLDMSGTFEKLFD